jgi:WD40 repeat protein
VARQAGARALITEDIDESLLLAVAGVTLSDSPQTRSSLLATLGRFPSLVASTPLADDRAVASVATSPGGRTVATLDDLFTVRLHDVADGSVLASRQVGPPGETSLQLDRALEFSPDGRWLAAPATPLLGTPLALLDATTLEPAPLRLGGLPRDGWVTTDLAFSADSDHLAATISHRSGPRGTEESARVALVWDLASPERPWRYRVPGSDGPTSVALSPDGRVVFTGAPLTRHVLTTGETRDLPTDAVDLAMSPDGRFLAATQGGFGALLLDGGTGRLLERLDHPNAGDLRFSRDGRTLATIGDYSREVRTWWVQDTAVRQRTEVQLDAGTADSVDLFPDGSAVVSASGGGSLRTWDLTGDHRFLPRREPRPGAYAGFGVVSPGGSHLVQLTDGGFVFVDLTSGERSPAAPYGPGYRHTVGTWHPDGQHYATVVGSRIRVWDITTGARADGTEYPSEEITEIDFSPDGSTLAVAERTGRVRLLDAGTLRPIGEPVDVGDDVSWVQLRPDNRSAVVLVGGPGASTVLPEHSTSWALVDLAEGRVVRGGPLGIPAGLWLAVSPDGRYAAVGGGDSSDFAGFSGTRGWLVVIDLDRGEPVGEPVVAHEGATYQTAWSPDGSHIVSSGLGGTVAVWGAPHLTELARVAPGDRPSLGAEFLPDGESVRIAVWESGTSYTLSLAPDRAVAFACRAVGRSFTTDEWRQHFGDRPYMEVCDQ